MVEFVRTPDILAEVRDLPGVKVGFAAETEDLLGNAREKLVKKGLNLIVANDVSATDAGFKEMREYYSEEEIVEILYVVCYFGFLNRWNDSCATELEGDPTRFAEAKLGGSGWQSGKHAAVSGS